MCGIFGLSVVPQYASLKLLDQTIKHLGQLSESRGSDASGVTVYFHSTKKLLVFKSSGNFSALVRTPGYRQLTDAIKAELVQQQSSITVVGHTRLTTNGVSFLMQNNQPIVEEYVVLAHNGIITNEAEFIDADASTGSAQLSDTSALARWINKRIRRGEADAIKILSDALVKIRGTAAVAALLQPQGQLCLYSNNGSLYLGGNGHLSIFASQRDILRKVMSSSRLNKILPAAALQTSISQVTGLTIVGRDAAGGRELGQHVSRLSNTSNNSEGSGVIFYAKQFHDIDYPEFSSLRRCSKCILPHTFPGLVIDADGVCSECKRYKHVPLRPLSELQKLLAHQVGEDNKVLVGLSGGRDSCYGLHVLKEELGFTPVAFTYDWGMVTDVARRNIANLCGELGVEHLIVSPDISKKLRNIRLNISAWLARPSLPMIPLFMAGDKYFYRFAHELRRSMDIKSFLFCAGNRLETTNFKTRFGFNVSSPEGGVLTELAALEKIKLFAGYAAQCAVNPRYLNSSVFDTLGAFYSSYILRDDYIYLYHFYPWEESVVEGTLTRLYDWSGATPTTSGWRVGDGTAAFYNYIYYVVAGFTEHDTFRANQIREGSISRDAALKKVEAENQPRWEMLEWYASRVGFNLADSLRVIHGMRRLYA